MQVNDKPGGPHGSGKVVPSNNVPNTNKHATQGMYEKMDSCLRYLTWKKNEEIQLNEYEAARYFFN